MQILRIESNEFRYLTDIFKRIKPFRTAFFTYTADESNHGDHSPLNHGTSVEFGSYAVSILSCWPTNGLVLIEMEGIMPVTR